MFHRRSRQPTSQTPPHHSGPGAGPVRVLHVPGVSGGVAAPQPLMAQPTSQLGLQSQQLACPVTSDDIVRLILQLLCDQKGQASLSDLKRRLGRLERQWFSGKRQDLLTFLQEYNEHKQLFHIQDGGGRGQSSNILIVAHTELTLCEAHASKHGCSKYLGGMCICNGLHICKFFILGNCRFGENCTFGHSLLTDHNQRLLGEHLLDGLSFESLRLLLQKTRTGVTTWPRICKFYNNETGCKYGEKCNSLHVCRHFLKDCCKFGKTCKRSHNIYEPKAKSILRKFGIDVERSPKEVLKELIQVYSNLDDDTSSMGSSGDRGSVSYSSHRRASARARSSSRPRTASSSKSRTASESSDISLPSGAASPSAVTSKLDIADSIEGGEICSYYLVDSCLFGDKCWKVHSNVPFQWQHQLQNTGHWQNFPEDINIDIEKFYCLPERDSYMYLFGLKSHKLDFDDLILISPERKRFLVRRLSTASSVKADEAYALPTKWLWYWEDEEGTWKKYGSPGPRVTSANVCMEDIEKSFQENPLGEINFTTNDHDYTLNFESMSQKNTRYTTQRKVRRRPQLQTKSDVQAACVARKQKKAVLSQAATGQTIGGITIPKHWQLAAVKGCEYYKKVKIENSGSTKMEYEEIAQLFSNTMQSSRITAIHRIENLELWENYCRKRSHMQRKLSPFGQVLKEERLFHGTRQRYMDAIERDGFDWRLSGSSVGTKFGKGSYFARDANFSRCYADSTQLFVVKVLVGDFAKGGKDMVRPPPKDPLNPTGALYNSCVDKVVSPQIYVIFDHSQAYPEYIIEYN